jgi:hypothetical protein
MATAERTARPLFRLARDLLERRDAATGSDRAAAQSDLDAALDAIEEDLDARIAALPEPSPAERFPQAFGRRR